MSRSDEGIGSRKWSLLDNAGVVVVHEGRTAIAALTPAGEKVMALIVTIPQLWEATNDYVRMRESYLKTGKPGTVELDAGLLRVMNMLAKSVGKDDWHKVLQG